MEVYILDSLYRRTNVVDRFESLIWTERRKDLGDFELLLPSNPTNRTIFAADTRLALNESRRIMVVETVEDDTDAEGRTRLKVKGRSIEKILEDRPARPDASNTTDKPKWLLNGTPDAIARTMFNTVCVVGAVTPGDIIPNVLPTNMYPAEGLPFDTEVIDWEQDPATLLAALKDICDTYEMGFRLYRNGDSGNLYFNIYTGNDRTTSQTTLSPVIFTPALETLQNTKRLMTIQDVKNVAYVINEQGFQAVYASNVDPAIAGFERRVLHVTAPKLTLEDENGDAVEPTQAQIDAWLYFHGKVELTKHRALLAFDGEINQRNPYKYERDYFLGDLIEVRDDDGVGNSMRVTEQIFVSDAEGDRAYPTLVVNEFIVPGTWSSSYLGSRQWADFGATEYWNTMP